MAPGMQVIILNPAQDDPRQIATALAGRSSLAAIHIISHGASGALQLGAASINAGNPADYQTQLTAIGAALAADGDPLLYGCDVAQGAVGHHTDAARYQ